MSNFGISRHSGTSHQRMFSVTRNARFWSFKASSINYYFVDFGSGMDFAPKDVFFLVPSYGGLRAAFFFLGIALSLSVLYLSYRGIQAVADY